MGRKGGKERPGPPVCNMSTWKLQAFLIYLYNIGEFNGYILSICNYAGDDVLLVDAAANLAAYDASDPFVYLHTKPCSTRFDTVLVTMLAQLRAAVLSVSYYGAGLVTLK